MSKPTDARTARAYLLHLCDMLDARQPLARQRRDWWNVAVPIAAGLAASLTACGGTVESNADQVGAKESCTDGVDNDSDGLIDCHDPDCAPCGSPVYSVPYDASPDQDASVDAKPEAGSTSEICKDGIDNDHDGKLDCLDPDCFVACSCQLSEACTNGVDDDCDGLKDCEDPNCSVDLCCGVTPAYAAPPPPPELCANGLDDNCDGKADCTDPQCAQDACCNGVGSPEVCGNSVDDDCDGLVDCKDLDCAASGCACTDPNDCAVPAEPCLLRTCDNGLCGTTPYTGMAQDDEPGNCFSPYCTDSGQIHQGGNDGDAPISEACEQIVCFDTSLQHYKKAAGTPCGTGLSCDADGKCTGCTDAGQCPAGDECRTPTCEAGTCGFQKMPDGYVLNSQTPWDCRSRVCKNGRAIEVADDADRPQDINECTFDVCTHGNASHPNRPAGTACAGGTCDGQGKCL